MSQEVFSLLSSLIVAIAAIAGPDIATSQAQKAEKKNSS